MDVADPDVGLDAKLDQARRLSSSNIGAYAWRHHRDDHEHRMNPAPHHQVLLAYLQDRKRFPYFVCVMPPGYAKSTYGSVVYPAWRLGESKAHLRMGIISSTATQAEGFSRAVQNKVEDSEYQTTFPEVMRDPQRRWTQKEMFFTNTPSGPNSGLMAMGMDGPILGRRFDEILLDDPSTWDDVRSETTMDAQRAKIQTTIITRFPVNGRPPHGDGSTRMAVFMTRFGERDLLPLFQEDLGFRVLHMPALGYWDRTVHCTRCGKTTVGKDPCEDDPRNWEIEWGTAALWPEKQSRETLEQMRRDDEILFELVYQGNPKVLSGDMFDGAWFRKGRLPGSFDRVIMGVDTAGGKDRKHGDYIAIVTLGFKGNDVWVIEAWRDRIPAPEQRMQVMQKYRQWYEIGWIPDGVVIEDVREGTALIQDLTISSRMPIVPVTPDGDKEFRAIAWSNAYRAGRVWHPENVAPDGTTSPVPWTKPYEAELMAFPNGAHDDMLDAAVYAYNYSDPSGGPRLRVL